jgi:2-amino-4-hydroxy-6-hydroxymethyldihydropteridine diphosphokinase
MKSVLCAIALGSNLGDSQTTLDAALGVLDRTPGIRLRAQSRYYQTKALVLPNAPPQPDYLNGCALLETTWAPDRLMTQLLHIETQFGRVRRERWGARTLDLDLLLFDDVIVQTTHLTLPHPRMTERAFVLVPLAEIAPAWVEPHTGQSIAQLAQAIDPTDIRLVAAATGRC